MSSEITSASSGSDVFDYDAPVDAVPADVVAADIVRCGIPEPEPEEVRAWRIIERQLWEAADQERRARERERRQAELAAERERQHEAERRARQQALSEKLAAQARERQEQSERDRIRQIEAWQQAETVRRQQEAEAKRVADYWNGIQAHLAEWTRQLNPPAPDPAAQHIAALEAELAERQAEQAADAERLRSQRYYANQKAAIARRESGR